MIFLTFNTITELLCLLAAVLFLSKDKDPAWRLAIIYMALTCLGECTGIYVRRCLHQPNYPVYNTLLLFECAYLSFFFKCLFRSLGKNSNWLLAWFPLFFAVYIVELCYVHPADFADTTASFMSVFFVLLSLYFYYLLITGEKLLELWSYPEFWWASGALFFYFGSTVCNTFFNYLSQDRIAVFNHSIRYLVFNLLNLILYGCWSYAFLCRYRQRNSLT
ncbi:hypothetical protein SAMN05216490_4055 [Mucilaginibacter mallensis]|uniref:YhhN-like protein n=1 Tax=Mucilaginibacter mallensis TaxID=652787 RepID=A0A1H2BEB0_MUCMA|nr:hypothetical protein [Mucilaginibacter mallensis]SDT56229.1 hypothetical protein SAMN05216490_4055 [Mucilaginibacter mallensis]